MAAKGAGSGRIVGWFSAFILFPIVVWFEASRAGAFEGKSLSNVVLEPFLIAVLACTVFLFWFYLARAGLTPLAGLILLVVLCAAAFAVQRFTPGLRE